MVSGTKKSQNQSISHWIAFEVADGKAMTSDHVLCWSSSVKPLMSIALGQLQDRKKTGEGESYGCVCNCIDIQDV